MIPELKKALGFLPDTSLEKLRLQTPRPGDVLMPHSLSVSAKLDYSQSLAVIAVLHEMGLVESRLLIYHDCNDFEVPVRATPLDSGFPHLPWICPECEAVLSDKRELRFDVDAKVIRSLDS